MVVHVAMSYVWVHWFLDGMGGPCGVFGSGKLQALAACFWYYPSGDTCNNFVFVMVVFYAFCVVSKSE